MTVALQEADLLFNLLRGLDGNPLTTLTPTFLTKAEKLISDPWAMSAIPDFIYPETTGERPPNLEDRLNFQRALGRLAARDAVTFELLTEIRHVLRPLSLLDGPSLARRVKEEMAKSSHGRQSKQKSILPQLFPSLSLDRGSSSLRQCSSLNDKV
jgi:hypothetical protein